MDDAMVETGMVSKVLRDVLCLLFGAYRRFVTFELQGLCDVTWDWSTGLKFKGATGCCCYVRSIL